MMRMAEQVWSVSLSPLMKRTVMSEARGLPIVFSLWTFAADVAELCGDAAVPATTGLLAIDDAQVRRLKENGVFIDLTQFTRSDSTPGVYYALFDHLSPAKVHDVLHRLVPSLEPHDGRTLTA